MKGKSKSSQRTEDCPLTYPDLKTLDHNKHCLLYSEVLHRDPANGTLAFEELDGLQEDLIQLQAAVNERVKTLQAETDVLAAWQDSRRGDKKSPLKVADAVAPVLSVEVQPVAVKRERDLEPEKMNKRLKEHTFLREPTSATAVAVVAAPAGPLAAALRSGPGRPRSGKPAKLEMDPLERTDAVGEVARIPKSDAPEKFWAMVEPYCSEITAEDLKVLEEILRSHEDDAEYYKVPALGKHYAQKWAVEDMIEEKKEGTKILVDKRMSAIGSKSQQPDGVAATDEAEDVTQRLQTIEEGGFDSESPFGPLTQRLVSALIEENVMTPIDDMSLEDITGNKDSGESIANMDSRTLARQLNLRSQGDLEQQIRRELEAEGILDSDDASESGSDSDEILAELKKKQEALRLVSHQNLVMTKRLQRLAREEMARQDLRKRLTAVDADVMDAYRRIQASRLKRRSPTKKEKDVMFKALRDRDAIVKQLEHPGAGGVVTGNAFIDGRVH